jgi:hypothetical protein
MKRRMILVGWLVMGVCLGVIATWLIGLRHTSTLLDQASELGRELRRAEQQRLNADDLIKNLASNGFVIVDYDRNNPTIIELRPETNIFRLGGRWLIFLELDSDRRIIRSNTELQPVGWP